MRLKGYAVTIFEALDQAGGMLRVGIPDYRLPPEVLDNEIDFILKHGIEIRTGVRFGQDLSIKDLREDGFSAIFLGIGAHDSIRMHIAGEDQAARVIDALGFLREVNLGGREVPGKRELSLAAGMWP